MINESYFDDSTGLLSGISEMDETFFAESFKGQGTLGDKARKRGRRRRQVKTASVKSEEKVKQIPVMVAVMGRSTTIVYKHI